MTERERLARQMLQESGIEEGEVYDLCLQDAMKRSEEDLKMIIGFNRIVQNKDQEPYAAKYHQALFVLWEVPYGTK